jgi:hypothetical protein
MQRLDGKRPANYIFSAPGHRWKIPPTIQNAEISAWHKDATGNNGGKS